MFGDIDPHRTTPCSRDRALTVRTVVPSPSSGHIDIGPVLERKANTARMVLSDGTQLGQSANANLLRDVKGMFNIISKLRHARLGEGEAAAAVVPAAAAAAAPVIAVAGPVTAPPAGVAAPLVAVAVVQAGGAPMFVDDTDSDDDDDDDIIVVSDDE